MDSDRKRDLWTDTETRQMLLIVKSSYKSKLLNNTNKRNLKIFEEISKDMAKLKYRKNAIQIRVKFKSLKLDYRKFIQNSNANNDSIRRQTKQHFKLLNDIFADTSSNTNETFITADGEAAETETVHSDPLLVTTYHVSKTEPADEMEDEEAEEIVPEACGFSTDDEVSGAEESNQTAEIPQTEIEPEKEANKSSSTEAQVRTFKQQKRQSYHNVVENFTREWRDSQSALMQTMEQQDQMYLRAVKAQCKRQEAMLREDRQEMARILKEDREEMKSFFASVLQSVGLPAPNAKSPTNNSVND